ncbi:MAG: hypothetical protein V3U54_07855 [Thermodesulfobacteriota bacterium]
MKKSIIGLVVLFWTPVLGHALETVTVTVTGVVLNEKEKPIETQRKSLIAAQHTAIENAIGVYVKAHSKVDKSILVENVIKTQTQGRIKNFKVLSRKVEGVYHKTKIKAVVVLAEPNFKEVETLESKLNGIIPRRMFMGLTYVNGRTPNDREVQAGLQDPMKVMQNFTVKLTDEAPHMTGSEAMKSISMQFGLDLTPSELADFTELLDGSTFVGTE